MDASILDAAGHAFVLLMDPFRIMMLFGGVLMGLFLGIVPGIGGLTGMALLLPFTFSMDSYAAFAMLLGMSAVIGTSDTIPSVLFGVPGSSSSQATVLDGNQMAKRGEAGRALSAAYTSSVIGGLFGALMLGLLIPMVRPVVLKIASPELLAMSIFGISMVAVLSGRAPLRGLITAALGILLSMVGDDPQTGAQRWVLGTFYLWDGVQIVPMVLGLFALPELADLLIRRAAIAQTPEVNIRQGMAQGVRDALKNWTLVLRCGGLGAAIGALPGLGSSVVDWIAYGHALQTVKGAQQTFGKGDVRGVIAPESANNAITAGALVPTIAFGVPGSASMAILLSVFLIHGLVPGPAMLSTNLDVTYLMVWSVAFANILGAGICFLFSGQLAKLTTLRYTLILPAVVIFVYIGSFQSTRNWGDLYTLLVFAVIGYVMRQAKWPRPPLVLGFVLGALIERYMFIVFNRYGLDWVERPFVMIMLVLSIALLIGPFWKHLRALGGLKGAARNFGRPEFRGSDLVHVGLLALLGWMMLSVWPLPWAARIGPLIIGLAAIVICVLSLLNQVFSRGILLRREAAGDGPKFHGIMMDSASELGELTERAALKRAGLFLGYMVLFLVLVAVIGFIPAIPVFILIFMRREGPERWQLMAWHMIGITLAVWAIFDKLLHLPWPPSLLGQLIPALQVIPSV